MNTEPFIEVKFSSIIPRWRVTYRVYEEWIRGGQKVYEIWNNAFSREFEQIYKCYEIEEILEEIARLQALRMTYIGIGERLFSREKLKSVLLKYLEKSVKFPESLCYFRPAKYRESDMSKPLSTTGSMIRSPHQPDYEL